MVRREPKVSEEHVASILKVEGKCKQETKRSRRQAELNFPHAFAGYVFGLIFYPEVGGNTFLRNFVLFPNYTTLKSRTVL
jgi:hypothetical protein